MNDGRLAELEDERANRQGGRARKPNQNQRVSYGPSDGRPLGRCRASGPRSQVPDLGAQLRLPVLGFGPSLRLGGGEEPRLLGALGRFGRGAFLGFFALGFGPWLHVGGGEEPRLLGALGRFGRGAFFRLFALGARRRFGGGEEPRLLGALGRFALTEFLFERGERSRQPPDVGIAAGVGDLNSLPADQLLHAVRQHFGMGHRSPVD